MLRLCSEIRIGNFITSQPVEVKITSTWRVVGDSCTISLPNLKSLLKNQQFKRGDKVIVKLGYNDSLRTEFQGFVKSVRPNTPLMLECEDYIYKCKEVMLESKSCSSLFEVLALIKTKLPEIEIDKRVTDITFGSLRVDCSAAVLLEKLVKDFGLAAFFKGKVLYVGLPMLDSPARVVKYQMGPKQVGNVVATKLEFRTADEVKLKVKAIGVTKASKTLIKQETIIGDADGEQRTLYFWDVTNQEELAKLAKAELEKHKFDGYSGSLIGFGWPYVEHGDSATILDEDWPERSGSYYVDEVQSTFGRGGFRREVFLGLRLDVK